MGKTISALLIVNGLFFAPAANGDVKYVKLVNAESNKVLTTKDASEKAGSRVVVAKDDGSEAQQWKLEKDGDHLKIVNRKSGKVLDVAMASLEEGAWIIVWDAKEAENDNQRWSWEGDGQNRRLKSKLSGLVLDVEDDETLVQRSIADKAKEQLWKVVEVKGKSAE